MENGLRNLKKHTFSRTSKVKPKKKMNHPRHSSVKKTNLQEKDQPPFRDQGEKSEETLIPTEKSSHYETSHSLLNPSQSRYSSQKKPNYSSHRKNSSIRKNPPVFLKRSSSSAKRQKYYEEGLFDLSQQQRQNQKHLRQLEQQMLGFERQGEFLKADAVLKQIQITKKDFSQQLVFQLREEIREGKKLLDDNLFRDRNSLQQKFDDLKDKIVKDFEHQRILIEKDMQNNEKEVLEESQRQLDISFKKSVSLLQLVFLWGKHTERIDQGKGLLEGRTT